MCCILNTEYYNKIQKAKMDAIHSQSPPCLSLTSRDVFFSLNTKSIIISRCDGESLLRWTLIFFFSSVSWTSVASGSTVVWKNCAGAPLEHAGGLVPSTTLTSVAPPLPCTTCPACTWVTCTWVAWTWALCTWTACTWTVCTCVASREGGSGGWVFTMVGDSEGWKNKNLHYKNK